MKPFLSFQGSRACLFSDLFTGDPRPLRIPFDRLRAAVSPIPKSRKEQRPPASLLRNDFMVSPLGRIAQVRTATTLLIRRVPHPVSLVRNERLPIGLHQRMSQLQGTEYTG